MGLFDFFKNVTDDSESARAEPRLVTVAAPPQNIEPLLIDALKEAPVPVQVTQPALEHKTETGNLTMKRIFIAVPVEGRTAQEVQTSKSTSEAFCRAIYAAQGETIEVTHYADLLNLAVDSPRPALSRGKLIFDKAVNCDAAFFGAGCESDRMLGLIQLWMDSDRVPYHAFCLRNA